MPKTHLPFGKIVATPTPTSWSQAYGAGGLFVALSLTTDKPEHEESLGVLGKKALNDLEAEFFTLEEKSLHTIQEALNKSFSQLPSAILLSVAIAYVKESVLYVFLLGTGQILLKRDGQVGELLRQEKATLDIQSASGFLGNNDLVVLQTEQFASLIPEGNLKEALGNDAVEDIAETLSPLVHGKEEGGAAAIFFRYLKAGEPLQEEDILPATPPSIPVIAEVPAVDSPFPEPEKHLPHPQQIDEGEKSIPATPRTSLFSLQLSKLSHRQRLLLSIAGILIVVLVASIFFTTQNAKEKKAKELFAKVYEPAKKYYDEGTGVLAMTPDIARNDLQKAKTTLDDTEKQMPPNSEEAKKISALKKDIDQALSEVSGENQADVKEVDKDTSKMLADLQNSSDRLFVTQDEDNIYYLTEKEVGSVGRDGTKSKTLIKNDNDWTKPAGLGTFLGNLYILDKDTGILKFVKGSDGYGGKTSYFAAGKAPDLTNAVDMTIDSSIYVLSSTGEIAKFTKGAPDTFKVSGLSTPLKSPTRIYTTPDFSSMYVLDNGNARIVKLSKDGVYQSQYKASILKNAKDFEIDETNKKAYILSSDKLYGLQIQ